MCTPIQNIPNRHPHRTGAAPAAELLGVCRLSDMPAPFRPQNCPSCARIWIPSNACFLGPTRVHITQGFSIGSAAFAELTVVIDRNRDRPTDRQHQFVCSNRPYLDRAAMRSKTYQFESQVARTRTTINKQGQQGSNQHLIQILVHTHAHTNIHIQTVNT